MEKHDVNQNDERTAAVIAADANHYAKYWSDSQQLKPATHGIWTIQGGQLRNEQVMELFMADYRRDYAAVHADIVQHNFKVARNEEMRVLPITKNTLLAAIDGVLAEKVQLKLEETKIRLAFDPTADPDGTLLTRFVSNLTTGKVEVATAVIGDYIRNAKRKLMGMPVENTVVPVIVGPPGIGKSRNVDRLLSPLSDYRLDLRDVSYLTDSRLYKSFGYNYVGVLDLLLPLGQFGIETLKNFITAPVLQGRVLGTSHLTGFPNNIVLIGTSSYAVMPKPLDTVNRRIYEINANGEISREISESIDYLQMWRGVDEKCAFM